MKKTFSILLFLVLFTCAGVLKTFALAEKDSYIFSSKTPYQVEVRKVYNASLLSVKAGQSLLNLRLSGVLCNEYTKYREKYSSTNTKYFLEDTRATKISYNSLPTDYIENLLKENENNLFFRPQGLGFNYTLVGELFVGNQSVNDLLVQKGYCKRP